jgi:hypothetical protein
MAFDTGSGNGLYMPVAPAFGGYGGGFGGGMDGDGWLILLIIFALFGNGFGGWGGSFGGAGNMMLGYDFPWLLNGQQGINNNVNDGFRDQMLNSTIQGIQNSVTSGFGDVQLGIAGVNQNICQTGNSIVSAVNGAQNAITQQMYGNTIADLERSFASQTATAQGFNNVQSQLAQCCCDNRLQTAQLSADLARESCATRTSDAQNTRDIIDSQTRGTQAILDKLCALELDGVKAQVEAKNDRIAELQTQLNMANLAASQTAQNAFIAQGFSNEVDALYNRLNNCPVPTTPVYGRTPIFTCNQNSGCGCGCGGF